jgi:L-iditol 2-dehydrogenase
MRVARLHGPGDLRVEELPVPRPGRGELLVEIEACGLCPTDIRKHRIGTSDGYPLNPGHEWVGTVAAVGNDTGAFSIGDRVYGDTYAGYAEYAILATTGNAWSYGPLRLDHTLPPDHAVFVEPLADCLHAVHDQARIEEGESLLVVGAGQMGLQIVAVAAEAGAHVAVIDPLGERRDLAIAFGAEAAFDVPAWPSDASAWRPAGIDVVIVAISSPTPVEEALTRMAPAGRLVLFAGFGNHPRPALDLNVIHYRELSIIGSEWIGTPPNTRRNRYEEARDLIASGALPLDRLVSGHCDLEGIERAFDEIASHRALKIILHP